MLSDEAKKTIDALSKEELRQEIDRGNSSRFQGDKFAYLKTRYASIEENEHQEIRQEDVAHKTKKLDIAQEANILSRNANKLSKIAIAVSVIAAIKVTGSGLVSCILSILEIRYAKVIAWQDRCE
jgi:predicted metal-dependent hydrolase